MADQSSVKTIKKIKDSIDVITTNALLMGLPKQPKGEGKRSADPSSSKSSASKKMAVPASDASKDVVPQAQQAAQKAKKTPQAALVEAVVAPEYEAQKPVAPKKKPPKNRDPAHIKLKIQKCRKRAGMAVDAARAAQYASSHCAIADIERSPGFQLVAAEQLELAAELNTKVKQLIDLTDKLESKQ
jgi:hypothetical protein